MRGSLAEIEAQAKAELAQEEFRASVEVAKRRIRERRNAPWYRRVFPWRIVFIKLEN